MVILRIVSLNCHEEAADYQNDNFNYTNLREPMKAQ